MSDELSVSVARQSTISTAFWARKLHSLTGIVPIGAFLLEHFWTNSYSLQGPHAFNEAVEKLMALPYLPLIEVGAIGLPIAYHAIYGMMISHQGRPNTGQFNHVRNWMYLLQRVSGAVLLLYIMTHVYSTRIRAILTGTPMTFEYMADALSAPTVFALYLVGIASAVFHFANGLWSFLIGWGIVTTEKAMKQASYVCLVVGVGLGLVGLNALLGFLGKGIAFHIG